MNITLQFLWGTLALCLISFLLGFDFGKDKERARNLKDIQAMNDRRMELENQLKN